MINFSSTSSGTSKSNCMTYLVSGFRTDLIPILNVMEAHSWVLIHYVINLLVKHLKGNIYPKFSTLQLLIKNPFLCQLKRNLDLDLLTSLTPCRVYFHLLPPASTCFLLPPAYESLWCIAGYMLLFFFFLFIKNIFLLSWSKYCLNALVRWRCHLSHIPPFWLTPSWHKTDFQFFFLSLSLFPMG